MNAFGHNDSAVPSAKTIIQDVQSLSRLLSNSKRTKQMDLSLNNTMVQIIACLRDDGQQSVPRIARKLDVGRQHIQRTVNDLMERDLVCRLPNPDHQRSWLINLTQNGQSIDESRNKDEMALAQTLMQTLGIDELRTCHKVLAQLKQCLSSAEQTPQSRPVQTTKPTIETKLAPKPGTASLQLLEVPHTPAKSTAIISWGSQASGLNL